MTRTLGPILLSAGIDLVGLLAIRHAFLREHEGGAGLSGIHADSTDDEILACPSQQSARPQSFPFHPPLL